MGIAKLTKRTAVIGSAIAVAAVGGGIAFAAWTSNGAGTGSASADTAHTVNLSPGTISSQLLFPGAHDVPVKVNVDNPNGYAVDLTQISGIVSGPANCNAVAAVPFTAAQQPVHVAAGASTDVLIGTLAMTNDAAPACAGGTFTVTLSATATSAP